MKKSISLLLSLVMLLSLFSGLALTASAADTALEICVQYGADGTPTTAKSYSAEELAALAETKAEGYGYYYYKSGAANAVAVTEYVTLDSLLSDAGTTFASGDTLSFMTGEEAYTKGDFSYENLSARGVDEDGNNVPTAIAITWEAGSLETEDAFAALVAAAQNTGSLRFVSGMTAEEQEAKSAMGNRMPSGVTRITVVKPESEAPAALEIYTKVGSADAVLSKSYTASDLAELAETNEAGYSYIYWKGDAMKAVVATEYVTLESLFSDAAITFASGDSLQFTCADGPYSKGDFSFETMSQRGYDAEGKAVPTALALTYGDDLDTQTNTGSLRLVSGATSAELEAKSAAGNRMPSGVIAVTVVKSEPAALEIYTQTGSEDAVLNKSYTASELEALAETTADGYGYYYYKSGAANAVAVTEYVPLDSLLSDAGTTFASGDTLSFMTGEEAYTKGDFSYENLSARGVDEDGSAVPTAIAITWEAGSLETEDAFAALVAAAQNTGSLRFVSGMTAEEREAKSAMGNRMPSGVTRITVVKPEQQTTPTFTDVKEGSYYCEAVYWAAALEIVKGTTETTFSPNKACTRSEMVTFLWRAAGCPAPNSKETSFTDIKEGSFYYDAVLWAVEEGITKGTSETTFSPKQTVTRAEAVTFLFRLAKADKPTEAAPFTDVPANAYYSDAVAWACANGITKGITATTFAPKADCVRAQVVTFLYRSSTIK